MPYLLGKRSSPFALEILLSLNNSYSFVSLGVPFKLNTLLLTFFFIFPPPFDLASSLQAELVALCHGLVTVNLAQLPEGNRILEGFL